MTKPRPDTRWDQNMEFFALVILTAYPMNTNFCLTLIAYLNCATVPIAKDHEFIKFQTPPEGHLASDHHVMTICNLGGTFCFRVIATFRVRLHRVLV
jgi:hypothetical protein